MGKRICVLNKNKLNIFEVKTNLKFYKIKDKILKEFNTRINGIHNFLLDELEYFSINEEVKINGQYCFIEDKEILQVGNSVKMFYRGIKYPEILNLALLLRDGEISSIDKLNEYKAPLYIKDMKDSRKKRSLLNEYPFDSFVDDIISCFSLKKVDSVNYTNMEDLIKKIEGYTKYDNNIIPGDKEMFNICKKAEISMFIPDDYGDVNSGIYKFKQLLLEHAKIYSVLKES